MESEFMLVHSLEGELIETLYNCCALGMGLFSSSVALLVSLLLYRLTSRERKKAKRMVCECQFDPGTLFVCGDAMICSVM